MMSCVCQCVRFQLLKAKSRHVLSSCSMVTWWFILASEMRPSTVDGDFICYGMSCRSKHICGKSRPNVGISAVERRSFLLTVKGLSCMSGMERSRHFRQSSVWWTWPTGLLNGNVTHLCYLSNLMDCFKRPCLYGDAVVLFIGHRIYRSWVRVLAGHHCVVALGKLLTTVCLCHQAV